MQLSHVAICGVCSPVVVVPQTMHAVVLERSTADDHRQKSLLMAKSKIFVLSVIRAIVTSIAMKRQGPQVKGRLKVTASARLRKYTQPGVCRMRNTGSVGF